MIVAAALAAVALAAGGDLSLLREQLPQIHPNPYAAQPKAAFDEAADLLRTKLPSLNDDETAVAFMRLVASLGVRNGHTGIFPLDPGNRIAFHEYPLLPYEFADGVVVVGQVGGDDLVGARIAAVGGVPIAQVLDRIAPLVPHDNEATVRNFRFMYLMNQEVLHGLGLSPQFRFVMRDGTTSERELTAVPAAAYSRALGGLRLFPVGAAHARDRASATRVSLLAGGRVVYLAYNTATAYVGDDAARIAKLAARKRVRRIVVDLRNNSGGDNHTYPVLIETLRRLAVKQHRQLVVIAGRTTFSAAANFLGDLEAAARYLLVGEDSGGSPNLYGDVTPLDLPQTGLRVEVARIWWVKSRRGARDPRVTFHPDVSVDVASAQWLAGRDPALSAALAAPFAKAHAVH
jgi:hypothetical protein